MRILITGASSGIGRELAIQYAQAGWELGLVGREIQRLEATAHEAGAFGVNASIFVADVQDTEAMAQVCREFSAGGTVNVVIACAGIAIADDLLDGNAESIARLYSTNVIGVSNTLVPFVPLLRAQGHGTLVAVSSIAGLAALPGRVAYSSSKAAVNCFLKGLRIELYGSGVHAMAVCPGFVHTPMIASLERPPRSALTVGVAAAKIRKAIEHRRKNAAFPVVMATLVRLLLILPDFLVRAVVPKEPGSGSETKRA